MSIMLHLMAFFAGLFALKAWGVIEGTIGPLLQDTGSAPVEGTDAVQTVTIGGTPTGGSFRLSDGGRVSDEIAWNSTNNTLLANVRNALMGTVSVQTLTFAAISSGKFRLRYKGQETAAITWSSTNNTLVSNINTALEALPNKAASDSVTVAAGTMTNGLGTLTVTFTTRGKQPAIEVTDKRLVGTGADITLVNTTPGTDGLWGDAQVTVADVDLSSGIGDFTVTFDGSGYEKRVVPLLTVAENALTGTAPTVAVAEDTAGVAAFGRGLLPGGLVVDTNSGTRYVNAGTRSAPDYVDIQADEPGV